MQKIKEIKNREEKKKERKRKKKKIDLKSINYF